MKWEFYKENKNSKIWRADDIDDDSLGQMNFSFDKVHVYNLFSKDFEKLTNEQRELFKKEFPEFVDLVPIKDF